MQVNHTKCRLIISNINTVFIIINQYVIKNTSVNSVIQIVRIINNMNFKFIHVPGVALIAKFCINIAFLGAVHILATSPRHHQTSIQQVTAH